VFGRNLGWDSSGESKDDKRSLDAIMARATFGTSRCESPGCDPDDKAKLGEMQKGAGPMYVLSPGASVLSAAVL